MPDGLQFRGRCAQDQNAPPRTTVRAATTAVRHLDVAVLRAAGRVDGDLQSELGGPFADGETSLGDVRQPQRLLGYEEDAVSGDSGEHEQVGEKQRPRGLQPRSALHLCQCASK